MSATPPGPDVGDDALLARTLAGLVADGTLSAAQSDAVRAAMATLTCSAATGHDSAEAPSGTSAAPRSGWPRVLAEVGGYVGGTFVLAAAIVVTGPAWDAMSTAARLALLAVPAGLLLAAAIAVAAGTPGGWPVRDRDGAGPRRRLVSALAVVAAALLSGAAAVACSTLDQPADPFAGTSTIAAAVASVVLGNAYLRCRTVLLQLACAVAAGATALSAGDLLRGGDLLAGALCFATGAGWAALSLRGWFEHAPVGLAAAGVLMFVGAEGLSFGAHPWVGFLLLAGLAVAALAGYAGTRSGPMLVVGVVALAVAVPQTVLHYTHGSLGSGAALLVVGLSIVGASTLGLRLRQVPPPTR